MSARSTVTAALRSVPALAGTGSASRVFEGTFLQPGGQLPAWPAARFIVDNEPFPSMCGDSDPLDDDVNVQVDLVVDSTPAILEDLRLAVIAAFQSITGLVVTRDLDLYDYDAETKTHRRTIRFTLHY